MRFSLLALPLLLLFPLCSIAQNAPEKTAKMDWEEWEELFKPFDKTVNGNSRLQVGLMGGVQHIQTTMKRKLHYFGEYGGEAWESGAFVSVYLARSVDLRFGFLVSCYHFTGQRRYEQQNHTFDINMRQFRLPISAVYTFQTRFVQPQIYLGFNMGSLLRSRGHPFFQKDRRTKNYWTSTITSGLDAGLLFRVELSSQLYAHVGGGVNLVVLNPFDKIQSRQLQFGLGYRI